MKLFPSLQLPLRWDTQLGMNESPLQIPPVDSRQVKRLLARWAGDVPKTMDLAALYKELEAVFRETGQLTLDAGAEGEPIQTIQLYVQGVSQGTPSASDTEELEASSGGPASGLLPN